MTCFRARLWKTYFSLFLSFLFCNFLVINDSNCEPEIYDRTAFEVFIAVKTNNLKDVYDLIKDGADIDVLSLDEKTPLMVAIEGGNKRMVKLLVEMGADINAVDLYGFTPLMLAIKHRRKNMVRYLISKGADINAVDDNGFTPVILAVKDNNFAILRILENNGGDFDVTFYEGRNLITEAVISFANKVLPYLISKGLDINHQDKTGSTPIMHSIANGNQYASVILISQTKCDVLMVNNSAETAMTLAIKNEISDMIVLIAKKNGEALYKIGDSEDPFGLAFDLGKEDIASLVSILRHKDIRRMYKKGIYD